MTGLAVTSMADCAIPVGNRSAKGVLIRGPLEALFQWIHERIGLVRSEDFRAIGRLVDGEIVGVIAFTAYNGASLQMHMAGNRPGWANREMIREAFHYAFNVCNCNVVFGVVPSGNKVALDIDLRLGFEKVANISGAHPDGSLYFLCMRREDCRWLR